MAICGPGGGGVGRSAPFASALPVCSSWGPRSSFSIFVYKGVKMFLKEKSDTDLRFFIDELLINYDSWKVAVEKNPRIELKTTSNCKTEQHCIGNHNF